MNMTLEKILQGNLFAYCSKKELSILWEGLKDFIVYFYNMLKKGLSDCYTTGQKIGGFCGYVIDIACWIGVIYFYLH